MTAAVRGDVHPAVVEVAGVGVTIGPARLIVEGQARGALVEGGEELAEMDLPADARVAARVGDGQDQLAGLGVGEPIGPDEIPGVGVVDDLEPVAELGADLVGLAQRNARREIARGGVDRVDGADLEGRVGSGAAGCGHGSVDLLEAALGLGILLGRSDDDLAGDLGRAEGSGIGHGGHQVHLSEG